FFFFQAEDGIRDRNVTGVQTCALPIYIGGTGVAATGQSVQSTQGLLVRAALVRERDDVVSSRWELQPLQGFPHATFVCVGHWMPPSLTPGTYPAMRESKPGTRIVSVAWLRCVAGLRWGR